MPRILYISNTANFSKFNLPFMRWFAARGWIVDYAAPDDERVTECDNHFVLPIARSPYSPKNFRAYRELKKIIKAGHYDIVHCHTPVGALLARIACRNERRRGLKVIYTAHGFHFYKGAPLLNWLLYYPIEKLLARRTDCLITINDEDFARCKNNKFNAGEICKIDGVGIDLSRFKPANAQEKSDLRKEYGYADGDFILIYAAELNNNKNHILLIDSLPRLRKEIPGLKVIFAGKTDGVTNQLDRIHELGMDDIVSVLGYRKDIDRLFRMSDLCVSMSKREGLPVNVIEGLASGIPSVCTRIRGHTDIIEDGVNGYLIPLNNPDEMVSRVVALSRDAVLRDRMSAAGVERSSRYSVDIAVERMAEIYSRYMPS